MKQLKYFLLTALVTCALSSHASAGNATWSGLGDGSTWNSTANWSGGTFPNATADTATFSSAATVTTLGQSINVLSLTQNTTGNVSITDSTNTLTFNQTTSGNAIAGNAGQTLTLNLNTAFANSTAIAGGGGTITFGSSASPTSTTLATNNKTLTFSGSNSTVNIYSNISGGGTLVDQNLNMNLGNSSSPTNIKFGKAATNSIAALNIITSGVTNSSSISILGNGSGSLSQNSFTIGSNIAGTGTAAYSGAINMSPTAGFNAAFNFTAAAGNTLTFSNVISGSTTGTLQVKVAGPGTVVFGGANTYTAATLVSGGSLVLTNTTGSATGTGGSLAVTGTATLAGTGSSSGTAFTITGSGTTSITRANVLAGQTSSTDTNTTSKLSLTSSGASTITNANLAFNLNTVGITGGAGASNSLALSATSVTFSNDVLTLNLQGTTIVPDSTLFTLISSTTGGSGDGGSIFSGLSLTGSNVITGLSFAIVGGGQPAGYYNNSFLELVSNGAGLGYDIDVVVVPEPGTWVMMLGGFALLLVYQRRRQSKI